MAEQDEGAAWSMVVHLLLWRCGGSTEKLAKAAGISRQTVSAYLNNRKRRRSARTLQRLAAGVGLSPARLDRLQEVAREACDTLEPTTLPARQEMRDLASRFAQRLSDLAGVGFERVYEKLSTMVKPALSAAPPSVADRQEAPALWARLEAHPAADWPVLIEECEDFWRWSLVELLCQKSLDASSESVEKMQKLAEAALLIAELLPDAHHGQRAQGYAWPHLGNARRATGDLVGSREAFERGKPLWDAGASADPGLFSEARVLGLEASLLRAQRQLSESLGLLEKALLLDRGEEKPYLLLNKAHTLHVLEDDEGAIAALWQADPLIDGEREPRLLFGLRFNLIVQLCFLGRPAEGESLLPQVRELAERLGRKSDRIKVRWLEARIAAAAGREAEALAGLEQVRREFRSEKMDYDFALASVELAELHLARGRTAEVRTLVEGMLGIFQRQQVPAEALRALRLFRRAVEQDLAKAELARRLVRYLHRAQHDPELRFEG